LLFLVRGKFTSLRFVALLKSW